MERAFEKIVIRQADLDTLVAAFVLGVSSESVPLVHVPGIAATADLSNPNVLCLECGGSGEIRLGNFDHHGAGLDLPPACVQALAVTGSKDPWVRDLVDYAAAVDLAAERPRRGSYPNLSNIISGVRLIHKDPCEAFRGGMRILRLARQIDADIYGPMPRLSQWDTYLQAKNEQNRNLLQDAENAQLFSAARGMLWGYLESSSPGVHGYLREKGCSVTIAASPPGENSQRRKYSIAATDRRLDGLLQIIQDYEDGWGGPDHGTIIGSPFTGSTLPPDMIKKIIADFISSLDIELDS